jgi:branched-chain amino acid transport system substrate-binding protein
VGSIPTELNAQRLHSPPGDYGRPFMRHIFIVLLGVLFAAKAAPAADEIVIGEYGSMTGSQATFGISTDDGVKLAVQQRNAAGGVNGKQIRVIPYDDEGKQAEAVTAVTRLIQEDHVTALIGEVASSLSLAGGQVAQRLGVPMISPSSTNPKVTMIGDMVSRVCFIDPFQGYVGASFAKNKLNFSTAAVLYDRSQAYSSGLRSDFKKAFTKLGGTVSAEEAYSSGDNDYSAQLTAIKNANPDFVYVPGYYTEVVNIARQARKLGLTVPMIGGDGWVSDDLKNAGDSLNGCYFSDHYSKQDDRPQVKKFLQDFKAAYGQEPDSMAALGYDAANLLFDAMTRAKSLDGKDLAAAINSTKNFQAVTGDITIDANRNAQKGAVIQQMKDGEYSFFARVEPPQ